MTKTNSIKLKKGEYVVCAYAESAAGPGWVNSLIVVVVENQNRELRLERIQPNQWGASPELRALYGVSSVVHEKMTVLVSGLLSGDKGK